MKIRKRIFTIIQPDDGDSVLSRIFDWFITALILTSVVIVFVATFNLPSGTMRILGGIEAVASVVFTIEYTLRIITADFLYQDKGPVRSRIKYILSPMAVVDFVSILPFWLPMFLPETLLGLRALRLVRLLRILKLHRYYDAMRSLGEVVVLKKRELLGSIYFVAILMLLASLLMYSAEHDAQPDVFRNAFSGLWWAVATLTTVGYGDIYPVTVVGRFLGALIAFSGIAAVAIPTGIITTGLSECISRRNAAKEACAVNGGRDGAVNLADCARLLQEQQVQLERLIESVARLDGKVSSGHNTEKENESI